MSTDTYTPYNIVLDNKKGSEKDENETNSYVDPLKQDLMPLPNKKLVIKDSYN